MRETIAQMLKVEAEARRIVADADAQAAEIVRAARVEALALQEDAQRRAQSKAAEMVEAGLREARARREALLAEIDAKNDALRHIAPEKAEAAKRLILAALAGEEPAPPSQ